MRGSLTTSSGPHLCGYMSVGLLCTLSYDEVSVTFIVQVAGLHPYTQYAKLTFMMYFLDYGRATKISYNVSFVALIMFCYSLLVAENY